MRVYYLLYNAQYALRYPNTMQNKSVSKVVQFLFVYIKKINFLNSGRSKMFIKTRKKLFDTNVITF